MKQFFISKLARKFAILAMMIAGLVFIGFGEGVGARTATNDCCSRCNEVWTYCVSHYGNPNDPYKTYAQCVAGEEPDCADLVCTPGC